MILRTVSVLYCKVVKTMGRDMNLKGHKHEFCTVFLVLISWEKHLMHQRVALGAAKFMASHALLLWCLKSR